MRRTLAARPYRQFALALGFGVWAAAIAVAPGSASKVALAAPAVLIPLVLWVLGEPSRWLMAFFAAALLLPPLAAPVGNSGPHPSLVIAALGLAAGLVWLPRWRFRKDPVMGALLAFGGLLLASVAQAAWHSGGVAAAGSLARVGLFAISIYVYAYTAWGPGGREEPLRDTRRLYGMAVAAALFACVDFYFQLPAPAGYGPQFVWLDSGVYRRAQGLFYEASTLGNFCAFFLVMIAVCLTRPRREAPVSRTALWAGGTALFAALVLSYSRGSVVNLLVALSALAFLNRRRVRWMRAVPALVAGGALAALITWGVYPAFAEAYWVRLSASAEFMFSSTEGVLSGRVASWRALADWLAANPWQAVLGIGYKTLPYSDYLGSSVIADNMYLSLLVETGIFGLIALTWLNLAILRAAGRAARSADARTSFYGTWMLCFWCGQVIQMLSGDLLTYWRVLPVYFWVLALAVRV